MHPRRQLDERAVGDGGSPEDHSARVRRALLNVYSRISDAHRYQTNDPRRDAAFTPAQNRETMYYNILDFFVQRQQTIMLRSCS